MGRKVEAPSSRARADRMREWERGCEQEGSGHGLFLKETKHYTCVYFFLKKVDNKLLPAPFCEMTVKSFLFVEYFKTRMHFN